MSINKDQLCMGCMTALEADVQRCPRCGYRPGQPTDGRWLPPGTLLAKRYLVGRLLSQTGGGALYMGYDQQEDRKVWIEEYMPDTLGRRIEADGTVAPQHGRDAQFKSLLYDFVDNAQQLRGFSQKAGFGLVPVVDMVGQGGTAYAIYRYIESITLSQYLKENGGELSWIEARLLFLPLLRTLSLLHAQGIIHRGVSPETLLMDSHGKLWLFGFALPATRTAGSEWGCELYDGYTSPEQYAANGWQGTWTDVYAAAAVLYRMLTGTLPVSAETRWERDTLYPAAQLNASIPETVSNAMDGAMLLSVERRTPSIERFQAELLEEADSNTAVFDVSQLSSNRRQPLEEEPEPLEEEAAPRPRRRMPYALIVMLITTVLLLSIVGVIYFFEIKPTLKPPVSSQSSELSLPSEPSSAASVSITVPNFATLYVKNILLDPNYTNRYTFVVQEEYNEDGVPPGVVFRQSTPAGAPMPNQGATIILYVSKGSRTTTMPYLVGSTIGLATRTLDEQNIKYTIQKRVVESADAGLILETSISAGDPVVRDQDVVILVIKDDIPVSSSSESSVPEEYDSYNDEE